MAMEETDFKKIQDMVYSDPAVAVKVDREGHLWIDGQKVCHDFAKKLGPEALKVEIAIMRAIDNAEARTLEKAKRR